MLVSSKTIVLLAGLLLGAAPAWAQTPAATPAPLPVVDKVAPRYARLNKGFSAGLWFHKKASLADVNVNQVSDAELRALRALGVNFLRLPISMKLFTNVLDPGAPSETAMLKLDAVIARILAQDLAVIVTLFDENSLTWSGSTNAIRDAHATKFAASWKALAAHLSRHNPDMVFLEALNEPHANSPSIWYEQQPKILSAMRQGAPEHTLIASANMNTTIGSYDTLAALEALVPVADPNVVYNIHFYKPHSFTHQGAGWAGSVTETSTLSRIPYPATPAQLEQAIAGYPTVIQDYVRYTYSYGTPSFNLPGAKTPATWNFEHIGGLLARARLWALKYSTNGRKIYVTANEFGVLRATIDAQGVQHGVDADARIRWLHDVRLNLEQNGIAWGMWEYEGSFGLGLRGKDGRFLADPDTLRALGLPQQGASSISFISPLDFKTGITASNLNRVMGTAGNPTFGIKRVDLIIQRAADKKYWTFYDNQFFWSSTYAQRPALFSYGTWLCAADLSGAPMPAGADLPDGDYILTAIAYDGAGLATDASIRVRVVKPVPAGPGTSRVRLSSATALAMSGTIELTFTAALNAASVVDAARFSVEVNGSFMPVQSVSYDSRRGRVILKLAPDVLRSGDFVRVSWNNLLDVRGLISRGQIKILASP